MITEYAQCYVQFLTVPYSSLQFLTVPYSSLNPLQQEYIYSLEAITISYVKLFL